MLPSIDKILRDKTILLTGATGFVGKVILHQLLRYGPYALRVVCLVRPDRRREQSATERFSSEVLGSELFRPLRRAGTRVEDLAARRIEVIDGDLSQPYLGLSADRFRELAARVDLIINAAGAVEFEAALDVALTANTLGAEELLRLASAWKRAGRAAPPAFCHVSSCFVSATRSGPIAETLDVDDYPRRAELGIPFSPRDEVQALREIVARVRTEVGSRASHAERWIAQRLVEEGRTRAGVWGWPNVHSFTKALGERRLAAEHGDVPVSIVRPSIAEAAVRDPVPGWAEGARTMGPLVFLAWRGQRSFPIHPEQIVDVIPVDFVANATIVIAAMTLAGEASGVYHVSSGDRNPLDAKTMIELTGAGLRRERRRRGGWMHRILAPVGSRLVSEPTYRRYSAPARARWWGRAATLLERLPSRGFWAGGAARLRRRERDARFADSVFQAYRPVLHAAQPIFQSDRTHDLYDRLHPEDREHYLFEPEKIDWRRYWIDFEIPGLLQHAFPSLGEELRPLHPELAGETVGDLLESSARRHASSIAVERWTPKGMTRWTYQELAALVTGHGSSAKVPEIITRLAALASGRNAHAALVARVVELSASIELTSRDTVLALSPLHCEAAIAVSLLLPLARGARILTVDLDPDTAAADWRSVQIGMVVGTAADLKRWTALPERFGPQFRGFVCCDDPVLSCRRV